MPARTPLRIAVTGLAATYPFGGVFWDYVQYALGFLDLGHDVLYIEDAVTPTQVSDVLEALFERHIRRVNPPHVGEQDFMGIQGVHVVVHDVTPETEGIAGVDSHLTRNAISRARILIVGKDRRDGGDDDGPPTADESSDSWLSDAMRRLFPRLQPTR